MQKSASIQPRTGLSKFASNWPKVRKKATKASKEDEDFLNNFLDSYDAQQKKKNAPESAAPKPPTLQQRVQKAFPESQQVQPGSNVDDVISDFLGSYDTKPHA